MRIALINPPASTRYVHSIDEPLGLEYLAAQIKAEHEVLIIDSFSQKLSVKETIELLLEFSVDVVGISTVFSSTYKTSKDIFEGIKSLKPETITVSGGNTATFMAEELAALPYVDYVVRGEGDISFPALIKAISHGGSLSEIKGISYCREGGVVHNPDQPLVENLDTLPFPARELLPMSEHYPKSILSARGCAYGCSYCSTAAFWGKGFRIRSVDNIIDEIKLLNTDNNLKSFSFADDCFTLIPKRTKEICARIKELGINAQWNCTGRIETITEDMLKALSGAGCKAIFFGIESGSKRVLEKLGRRYSPEDVQKVYELCIAYGITPYFSFIIGLPFEDLTDINETYSLIQKLEGVENGIHMLTPFPGTPIAKNPSEFGLKILPHSVEELDINTKSYINTEKLSAKSIEECFKKAIGYSFKALKRSRRINEITTGSMRGEECG